MVRVSIPESILQCLYTVKILYEQYAWSLEIEFTPLNFRLICGWIQNLPKNCSLQPDFHDSKGRHFSWHLFSIKPEVHFWDFQKFDFRTSRSFLWNHEKDGNNHPVLSQLYIPYGMKRPMERKSSSSAFGNKTLIWNNGILLCFRMMTLIAIKGHFIRKIEFET